MFIQFGPSQSKSYRKNRISGRIICHFWREGRTETEPFKLPVKAATDNNRNVCSIFKRSNIGKLMFDTSLMVWLLELLPVITRDIC